LTDKRFHDYNQIHHNQ